MAERGLVAQRVHRHARQASAVAGRATSRIRPLPEFLIAGAQRCGTTSFYKTLAQHPDVLPAGLHKGVHFFDTNYQQGLGWYRGHFPTQLSRAWHERRTGTAPITGEASPYYMFHPAAPARIAECLPEIKIVVILRDPVERAYSAYTHERARGFETLDFMDALDREQDRLRGDHERLLNDPTYVSTAHQHNAYVARGQYAEQLENLEAALGRDLLHVIDADEMFADFAQSFQAVQSFLGLRPWLPEALQQRNTRPRASLDGAVRDRLESHFAPWDERLSTWWGKTPSWRA